MTTSATLVTGGAGYIGCHAVWALRDRGTPVLVVDDLSTGVRENLPPDVPLIVGDVGDAALLAKVFREHAINSVLHFAGAIIVPESIADPLKYYLNNTAASCRLIQAAVNAGVAAFIFSSTAAVYGIPDHPPVTEDAPKRPISPYGSSKLMIEQIIADASAAHGLRYGILRYFNVAGADPAGRTGQSTPQATHLIKIAAEVATGARERLTVFGTDYPTEDGTAVRDYIHVTDLIDAHLRGIDHLRADGEPFVANCGYGRGHSVREVIDAMERVCGHQLPVEDGARRPGDPPVLTANADRVRRLLGWQPQFDDLDVIVATALEWEKRRIARAT
jgi:UDP-glucose 4-epimerase